MTSVVRADLRTGKLVRSVVVTPKTVQQQRVPETAITPRVVAPVEIPATPAAPATASGPGPGIDAVVESIAARNAVRPELIHSVIKVESNYNPNAVSSKGALGLMQLVPSTARRFGVANVFNPEQNIEGGARYLKYLLDLFNNDYRLALAAYNAGEGAVLKYGDVPPYAETRNYLVQVRKRLEEVQRASEAAARQKQKDARTAEAKPNGERQIEQVVNTDGTVRYVAR